MNNHPNKPLHLVHAAFALAAMIILIDFVWPGSIVNDAIKEVKQTRQQYYNAARNYHYTYKVVTSQHKFLVSADFAATDLVDEKIEYTVSLIFKEVNRYRLVSSKEKSYYSLRIASGLVLPMLFLIALVAVYRYKKNLGIGLLILQIILIGDLILLMT